MIPPDPPRQPVEGERRGVLLYELEVIERQLGRLWTGDRGDTRRRLEARERTLIDTLWPRPEES